MLVTIEGIEQFVRLDGKGDVTNGIRIRLPDNTSFTAQVPLDVVNRILQQTQGAAEPTEEEPEHAAQPGNGLDEDGVFGNGELVAAPVSEEDQPIDWASLPETTLPAAVRKVLEQSGIPPVVKAGELAGLVDQIMEQMLEKAAQAQAPQGPAPLQAVRKRTVAKDELGYPVVPTRQSDPGEVALVSEDEDGVEQL